MELYVVMESTLLDFIESSVLGVFDSKEKAVQLMNEKINHTGETKEVYRSELRCGTQDGEYLIKVSLCKLNEIGN